MNFYVRRIAFYIVTLWAAISLNFLLPRLLPGDPAAIMLGKLRRANGGRPLSEETIQTITSILGAEKGMSLWDQYLAYWSRLLHGDLGISSTRYPAAGHRSHRRSSAVDGGAGRHRDRDLVRDRARRRSMGGVEAGNRARPPRAADDVPAVDSVLLARARARRRVRRCSSDCCRSSAGTTCSSSPRGRSSAGRSSSARSSTRSFRRRRSSSRRSAAGCSACAT